MDRISELSDELLVKILSLLPTKVAISTSILSKRWECLWMWLPKLDYVCRSGSKRKGQSLSCFLNRTLPLHRAPIIESLSLDCVYSCCKPEDLRMWVVIAVFRLLRELDISYYTNLDKQNILPSSLYACKSLSVLKLSGNFLLEIPRKVLLPCLKTLQLKDVTGVDGESLRRLLCICPVLENLLVEFSDREYMGKIIINVVPLQCLSLYIPYDCDHDGLEIDTPSLKYLKLEDHNIDSPPCLIENMPELEEADIDVRFPNLGTFIGAITSVKRLTICSNDEDLYGNGIVFNNLEHLQLCECDGCSFNLLASLLRDPPNLRALEISIINDHEFSDTSSWNQPLTVPTCFVSSLQTFKWSGYLGTPEETEVAVYILKNACLLKTATFMSQDGFAPKLEILKELALTSRASSTCQLVFY